MAALQADTSAPAKEAIDLFCYRAAGELARLAVAIGGLDALVFTAGAGENSARVREDICAHLRWLGVVIDTDANHANAVRIGSPQSIVEVLVIPTDEEATIAKATRALIRSPIRSGTVAN